MSIHHSISQMFENNLGNRITPELASGMIRGLIDILAAELQRPGDSENVDVAVPVFEERSHILTEGENGLV
ncbi:hypothetical protein NIZ92_07425 [Alcaligenes sp. 1735tsa3]|uniref:hypothetical protein n=1 Tax=Alcaligenes sp. 1735tsa3 TaxID=2953809 RepID=UPI0020A6FEB0|nr:hypothetical protein [Alcaligenes sp. 1735tsa3]USY26861.1 hypothetical protein NIZ92_07425 [Alcaligenes sp. 1735tsa3]